MVLHNDIWGDTNITIVEEIDNQFLIVRELNMLALYSRLGKKQSKILQEALISFYEIRCDYGDGSCFLTINRKNRKRRVLRG
mgnify:FL=1